MQQNVCSNIIDPSTQINFKIQLSIVRKIISHFCIRMKNLIKEDIVYQVSAFVFHNPLKLKFRAFSLHQEGSLMIDTKYMLVRKLNNPSYEYQTNRQSKADINQKFSSFITITKQWRAIRFPDHKIREILLSGKLFIQFISNYPIIPLNPTQKQEIDPIANPKAYQAQQKLKRKQHEIISDNLVQTHQQINIILDYEKDRKLNDNVVYALVNLMKKNIAILRIQQNYQCKEIGCQGKFIYFQNISRQPICMRKTNSQFCEQFGWLQIDHSKTWKFFSNDNKGIQLYKHQKYPLSRDKQKILMNSKLQSFVQNDIWLNF